MDFRKNRPLGRAITEFCEYNGIDKEKFILECIEIGFNVSKYGYSPTDILARQGTIKEIKSDDEDKPKKKSPGRPRKKETGKEGGQENAVKQEKDIEPIEEKTEDVKPVKKTKVRIIKK